LLVVATLAGLVALVSRGAATQSPSVSGAPTPEPAAGTPASAAPPRSPTPTQPVLLLPNMRSLRAGDLSIETVGDERRLRFAASLANMGPGPLLLLPQ
jgi:hypothetical protein